MFKQILIASHNPGKVAEFGALLTAAFPELEILSAADLPATCELNPPETGSTFAANAQIKAQAFALASGIPTLADDSGVVVPSLSDQAPFPGVHSARWQAGSDQDRLQALLTLLDEKAPPERQAYYECVLCLYLPKVSPPAVHFFSGRCSGTFAAQPQGSNGFGYDPAFIPDGQNQTFGELAPEIKNQISHRAQAFQALLAFLKEIA